MIHSFRNSFTVVGGIFDRGIRGDAHVIDSLNVCRQAVMFVVKNTPLQLRCAVTVGPIVAVLMKDEPRSFNCIGGPMDLANEMVQATPALRISMVEDVHMAAIRHGFEIQNQSVLELRDKHCVVISVIGE